MMFEFYDPDFFSDDKENVRYGKLLFINFKDFIKEPKNGVIQFKIDENFFCNQNQGMGLDEIVVLSLNKIAVLMDSGKDLFDWSHNPSHSTLYPDVLKIKTIIVEKQSFTKMPFIYYLQVYKSISDNSAA